MGFHVKFQRLQFIGRYVYVMGSVPMKMGPQNHVLTQPMANR